MSLTRRLLLILLLATVAIQVLSFGGVGFLRGYDTRMLRNETIGRDLAYVHARLLATEVAARPAAAADLRRGGYAFKVVRTAGQARLPPREDLSLIAQAVARHASPPPAWTAAVGDALLLGLSADSALLVRFDPPLESTRPPLAGIALYLMLVTAAVLAIAWVAVRVATRPLDSFTAAAHRLAEDVDMAPLPAAGPVEVRAATRAFNAMQAAIRRQLQERSQILAAISHDLKTPLTRLKLRLAALDAGEPRNLMEADVDLMAALVQDGLDYAHSRQLRETRVPVDLARLLQGIVDQAQDLGQDCRLEGRCGRPLPGAPRALERAVQNLVDNGLRYGQRVRIRLIERADEAEIQVGDDGPGLPPELREKVFEPYFRADASRNPAGGGSGLGLSIARNLVHAHGGRIWLEADAGGGLLARVVLPFPA